MSQGDKKGAPTEERVTPTEELILEVLAARKRLGESLWTFDSRHSHSLDRLRRRGLITITHGIVERTLRASLTLKGEERALDGEYVSPLLRDVWALVDRWEAIAAVPEYSPMRDWAQAHANELAGVLDKPRFRSAETNETAGQSDD